MSWASNETLSLAADELGDVLLNMLSIAGIPIDKIGLPDREDVDVLKGSVLADAMDYMALDPARLEQEYNDILAASRYFTENPDAKSQMNTANAEIAANWVGTASDAFALQVQNIVAFMESEETYMWYAAQGVSMMYALAVQFRNSYYDLAIKTTEVCNKLIRKAPIPTLDWGIVLSEAAQTAFDVVTMQSAKDLADVAVPLKEPVKVGMDVDSPDFSYDDFHYNDHDPNVYAPEVERERTKYAEERSNGLIATRLRGEG